MLEIIFLATLTKKIGDIVEQKGYKSGGYKVSIVVWWFGGEIMGAILGAIMSSGSESAQCVIYIVALIGAGIGSAIAFRIADNLPVIGPSLAAVVAVPATTLGSVTASQEDHLPKLKKLKEMYDTGLITAQDYDTQKAEILSRLVSEPTFTTQTAVSQQATVIQPTITASNKSPIGAAILSFFLLGGAGQIYLGQWKKGLVLMVSTFLLSFVFVGILIQIIGIGDAYGVAQKLSEGKSVGEWEFNINWKAAGLVTLIYAIAICGIVVLASSSPSR